MLSAGNCVLTQYAEDYRLFCANIYIRVYASISDFGHGMFVSRALMAYSHLMFWPDPLSQTLFLCIINDEIVLFGVLGR